MEIKGIQQNFLPTPSQVGALKDIYGMSGYSRSEEPVPVLIRLVLKGATFFKDADFDPAEL